MVDSTAYNYNETTKPFQAYVDSNGNYHAYGLPVIKKTPSDTATPMQKSKSLKDEAKDIQQSKGVWMPEYNAYVNKDTIKPQEKKEKYSELSPQKKEMRETQDAKGTWNKEYNSWVKKDSNSSQANKYSDLKGFQKTNTLMQQPTWSNNNVQRTNNDNTTYGTGVMKPEEDEVVNFHLTETLPEEKSEEKSEIQQDSTVDKINKASNTAADWGAHATDAWANYFATRGGMYGQPANAAHYRHSAGIDDKAAARIDANAQKEQAIANRDYRAEAENDALAKANAENKQNIANKGNISGAQAAMSAKVATPDYNTYMQRQDQARRTGAQYQASADFARQSAENYRRLADTSSEAYGLNRLKADRTATQAVQDKTDVSSGSSLDTLRENFYSLANDPEADTTDVVQAMIRYRDAGGKLSAEDSTWLADWQQNNQ